MRKVWFCGSVYGRTGLSSTVKPFFQNVMVTNGSAGAATVVGVGERASAAAAGSPSLRPTPVKCAGDAGLPASSSTAVAPWLRERASLVESPPSCMIRTLAHTRAASLSTYRRAPSNTLVGSTTSKPLRTRTHIPEGHVSTRDHCRYRGASCARPLVASSVERLSFLVVVVVIVVREVRDRHHARSLARARGLGSRRRSSRRSRSRSRRCWRCYLMPRAPIGHEEPVQTRALVGSLAARV